MSEPQYIQYRYVLDKEHQHISIRLSELEEDSYVNIHSNTGEDYDDIVLNPKDAWELKEIIEKHLGKAKFKDA